MSYRINAYVIKLLFLFLLPLSSEARHIIGGDITYVCLGEVSPGTHRYRFTMKIYRDCNGNGADYDNPAQMAVYKGKYNANIFVQGFTAPLKDDYKLVPEEPECATNLPNECVEEGIYEFELTLEDLVNDSYFIVYQRCCRNNTITNLVDPGDIGATYMIEITPDAMAVCNNTPTFDNFPPIIICKDFPFLFDHGATDADGDQLVYSFCAPWAGGGPQLQQPQIFECDGAIPTPPCAPPYSDVPFVVPTYTPLNPMGGSPQVIINPNTGFISGTPDKLGQFVVGVCVKEYRNGKLLSTVKREFQFNVTGCAPTVKADINKDSVDASFNNRYFIKSCGKKNIKIINTSFQLNFIDEFIWRFDLKNGNILEDKVNWSPTISFPDTGTYNGTLYLNPGDNCGDTAYVVVQIFPAVQANFTYDYDTCVAGPVLFTDASTGEGIVSKWNWKFGIPNANSTDLDPTYQYPYPGNHPVRLTVTDENGCVDDTLQVIAWFPAPPVIIIKPDNFLGCVPGSIYFDNLSFPIDNTYDLKWDFGDGATLEDTISPTHTYTEPGVYDVSLAITSPLGCYIADTFPNLIRVEPRPVAEFSFDPDTLLTNFNNTVTFTDESIDAVKWNWRFDKYGWSTQQNPIYSFPDTGLMRIRLIVTHPRGCQDSVVKYLDIRPEIRWYMPNAFTPNFDSVNEGFLGKGYMVGATNFSMTIWNRWGELVFETNDPTEAWNGRQMNTGDQSDSGVYVYVVRFNGPRGEPNEFKGFATLIR